MKDRAVRHDIMAMSKWRSCRTNCQQCKYKRIIDHALYRTSFVKYVTWSGLEPLVPITLFT